MKLFYPQKWLAQVGFYDPKHGYFVEDGDQPVPTDDEDVANLRAGGLVAQNEHLNITVNWIYFPAILLALAGSAFAGVLYGRALERDVRVGAMIQN